MGLKRVIRKVAKLIIASQPEANVQVNISQIQKGDILSKKNIVITGGGSGIGLSMAKKFISEGAKVLIVGRNKEKLDDAIKEIGNSNCYSLVYDVCDVNGCEEFLKRAKECFGGTVDCLVCNAGVSLHENIFSNVTVKGLDIQFNTKFKSGYFLGKAFLEMKLKENNNNSHLLYISSETGDQVYDIPYGMTNAAINSMVGAFSRRVYQKGIRVNAIAPGVTVTDMTKEYAEVSNGNMYRKCASGRSFLPEEIAEVACFLLSDASVCISGEIVHCNAGNHLKTFWEG